MATYNAPVDTNWDDGFSSTVWVPTSGTLSDALESEDSNFVTQPSTTGGAPVIGGFVNDGTLTGTDTINSVSVKVRHRQTDISGTSGVTVSGHYGGSFQGGGGGSFSTFTHTYDEDSSAGTAVELGTSFVTWTKTLATCPGTSAAWTLSNIFDEPWGLNDGPFDGTNASDYIVDRIWLEIDYTAAGSEPTEVPDAPSGLSATGTSTPSVNLSWTDNSSGTDAEDEFEIERTDANGDTFSFLASNAANDTTYTDSAVTNGATYSYRVRAVNDIGNSSYSNTAEVTIVPDAPVLSDPVKGNGELILIWSAVSSATSYTLKRGTAEGGPYSEIFDGDALVYNDILTEDDDTTYYYVVTASNSGGESADSNEVNAEAEWWCLDLGDGCIKKKTTAKPEDIDFPFPFFFDGTYYPKRYVFRWTGPVSAPTETGWWTSIDEAFSGTGVVYNNNRPKDPRSYEEVGNFVNDTNAGVLGGFPGPCCVFNNKLVYAEGGYTVGTTRPIIRVYDGSYDRELIRIPKTAAGVVPEAVMTMLAANGTIYVATFDTGTTSSDYAGRVFSLDIESGLLTPIGAAFTSGHVPYALAWHNGRLWCGTNRGVASSTGKIYYFRPDVDSSWTEDRDLTSDSVGGVTSMLSYKGKLYVGTSGPSGTFATVEVRSELGAWSTSLTTSGGTAAANNAVLAMVEFGGNLYASFFNNDTTDISKIYKFDNSSWTTAYTGASTTLRPFIGFVIDGTTLLAIGGGSGFTAALVSTTDGSTWSNRTPFLQQQSPTSTAVPCFGVITR